MDKEELVNLTLEKLYNKFKKEPECFQLNYEHFYNNENNFTIIWRPMIELDIESIIQDPNSKGAVAIKVSTNPKEISCFVFLNPNENLNGSAADSVITIKPAILTLNKTFRRLKKLKKLIKHRDLKNEGKRYFGKLSCLFPDVVDKYILKK
jgi:hypothetical protein